LAPQFREEGNEFWGILSTAGLMPEEVVPALAIRIETNAGKKECP
jgi:hypothetical protein